MLFWKCLYLTAERIVRRLGFIKRFFGLWNPKLTPMDIELVESYLDDAGKFLFFQMSQADQLHSISVAKIVISEAGFIRGLNHQALVKAALLHDVGKVEGELSFFSRLAAGTIRRINPNWRNKLAVNSRKPFWGKIRYGFYVDMIHPARGSHMAKIFGIDDLVVKLIRHHHDPPSNDQAPELTWLQMADSRN